MSDRYQRLHRTPRSASSSVKKLGLPDPPKLERYAAGAPLVDGTVARRRPRPAGRVARRHPRTRSASPPSTTAEAGDDATRAWSSTPPASPRPSSWSRCATSSPRCCAASTAARAWSCSARRRSWSTGAERVAQRALEGFTRSLGKEIGRGGTVQLVYVAEGAEAAVARPWPSCSPPSRRTSRAGRPGRRHGSAERRRGADWTRPLEGKVALVTGASRGIGEQIARVLHRDGATVVGVDVPQAASELQARDAGARRRPPGPRHHRQGRAAADRPPPEGRSTAASTSWCTTPASPATRSSPTWPRTAGTPVIARQPDRARADHPRAARPGLINDGRLDHRRRLDRGHRRQPRPDQLRHLQGRRDRPGRLARRRARRTASPSTRSRPASS